MPSVEHCDIAPGVTLPRILNGLWQVADLERDGRQINLDHAASAMQPYVDAGLTGFDMADHYGSAEDIAGIFGSRGDRQRVQWCTKWVPQPGPLTRDDVRAAVQRSLKRLRTERVDLMQFHAWYFADPAWLDALFYLQELRDEGLIGALGVTNFDTAHLRIALTSGIRLVSNQVSHSLIDQRAAGRMAALCAEHGVRILAYGTVCGGFLSRRWLDAPEPSWERLDTWSQMKYGRFIRAAGGWHQLQQVLRTLDGIANRHQVSMTNVASRYMLDQPHVAAIIVGVRLGVSEHTAENLRVFSFTLSDADRAEIRATLAALSAVPGDCGDEYRRPPFLTASGDLSHHLSTFPAPFPVRADASGRQRVLSGTSWETTYGYARALRTGNRILVSGTTASHGDRLIGGHDASAQMHFVLDKIEGAIRSLGGQLEDIVRTRVMVSALRDWEAVAQAHGDRLGSVQPANTLVQTTLVGDDFLVEVEAEAEVSVAAGDGRQAAPLLDEPPQSG
ncbi:MAG: aldo/keto reductase [Gemmatimonadaceae bacterium]